MIGEDAEHVQRLAESSTKPPPIIVHRWTMRVIDGMHRLRAAGLRGDAEIEARLYDGGDDDAFVLAVRCNATHGLPLSMEDRVNAATRIVGSHPNWSDRIIASTVGLSPKTVAAIRLRSAEQLTSAVRIGRDGRSRPVSSAARRRLAGELMVCSPDASLRQIANAVGLAPSTVLDVRTRLRAGRDVVPDNQKSGREHRSGPARQDPIPTDSGADPDPALTGPDRTRAIGVLMHDPSLRFTETGRQLLHWLELQPTTSQDWQRVIDSVPERWLAVIADLAKDSANAWSAVVSRLEQRVSRHQRQSGFELIRAAQLRPYDSDEANGSIVDRVLPRPR